MQGLPSGQAFFGPMDRCSPELSPSEPAKRSLAYPNALLGFAVGSRLKSARIADSNQRLRQG